MASNTDPQFDALNRQLKSTMDDLGYMRDFSKEIVQGMEEFVKGIHEATVGGIDNAKRMLDVMKLSTLEIRNMTNMLDVYHVRMIAGADAARKMYEHENRIHQLTADELKEVNKELGRTNDLFRVGSKDAQLRREMTQTLTKDIETQKGVALDAKRALADIDATQLENLKEYYKVSSLDLKVQLAQYDESIKQSEYRLALVRDYVAAETQIKEIQAAIAAGGGNQMSLISDLAHASEVARRSAALYEEDKGEPIEKRRVSALSRIGKLENHIAGITLERTKIQAVVADKLQEENRLSEIRNKLSGQYFAHMGDPGKSGKGFDMLGEKLQGIVLKTKDWAEAAKLIPIRFIILNALLKFSLDRFIALDKAAEKFRTETGFTIDQMAHVRKQVERVNVEFADMGVSIEKAYDSAKALTEEFQMTSLVTGEAVKNVALMSANLGVLEKDSASVLSTFQGLGGATEKAAFNVMKVGAGISGKVGVPFSLVMKDIANASETTLSMLSANPTVLMRSAIAARTLGTDLNKITQSQRKLLDFSSSITDELELSALLGTSISFQKSRQLAYEGKIEDAAKATLETVKAAGDFDKMSVYQREQLAKAAGMELKDLSKMLSVDKRRKEIENGSDQAAKDRLKAQDEALKQLNEKNDLSKQSLADEYESEIRQQKMQGIITNLKNTIDAIVISMADILEPIITPLAKILVPTLKVVGVLFRLLGGAIKWFLDPIVSVANWIGKWADGLKVVASKVSFVKDETKELGYYFGDVLDILASIGKIAVSVVAGGYMMGLFFGQLGFPKVMELLKKPFTSVVGWGKAALSKMSGGRLFGGGAVPVQTPSVPPTSTSVKPGSGTGIKDYLTNLGKGLKGMAGSKVTQGAGNLLLASPGLIAIIPGALLAGLIPKNSGSNIKSFLTGLAGGLNKMGTGSVAKGALVMGLAGLGFAAMTLGSIGLGAVALLGGLAGAGLVGLSVGLAALGNHVAGLGVLVLMGISAAMIGFAYAGKLAAESFVSISKVIPDAIGPFIKFALISPLLYSAAGGVGALSASLMLFAGASVGGKLISFFTGNPLEKFEKFAGISEQLKTSAKAIADISIAASQFSSINSFADSIGRLADSLGKLNGQLSSMNTENLNKLQTINVGSKTQSTTQSSSEPAPTDLTAVVDKLDEIYKGLTGGEVCVYLDGSRVSGKMSSRA